MSATTNIPFALETKMKIGKTSYIVTAHFDDNRETLEKKIRHLLCAEISGLSAPQTGHSLGNVV